MGLLNLQIDTAASTARLKELDKSDAKGSAQELINMLTRGISGAEPMSISASYGGVQASGTLTFDTVIATDVITVNGVTLACVASGADATEFNLGSDDEESAANAAAAVNASANAGLAGIVTASSAGDVVTITAVKAGLGGNAITIASADSTITAGAAKLAGGLEGDTEVINLGKAAS